MFGSFLLRKVGEFWAEIKYLKSTASVSTKQRAICHGSGISNEILGIIEAQRAAKLWAHKVWSQKMSGRRHLVKSSPSTMGMKVLRIQNEILWNWSSPKYFYF